MLGELAAKLVWTGTGLYVAWLAHDLGVGALNEPGPGMLAFGLGVLMASVAGAGFVRALVWRPQAVQSELAAPPLRPLRMLGLCVGLLAYIAALQPIGFPLATFAFLLLLLAIFARLSWLHAIALSAIVAVASYALFKFALGTQLPAGILG